MEFAIETDGADRVLHLSGTLTFRDQISGEGAFDRLFGAAAARYVIDVSELTFIDSVGLGLMMVARDLARRQNGALVLRHPTDSVAQALALAKYQDLFVIEN